MLCYFTPYTMPGGMLLLGCEIVVDYEIHIPLWDSYNVVKVGLLNVCKNEIYPLVTFIPKVFFIGAHF